MPLCPSRPCNVMKSAGKCESGEPSWLNRQATLWVDFSGKWGLHNLLSYESIFEVLVMRGLWAGIDVFVHPAKSPSLLRPKCIFTPGCVQMYNHTNVEMYIYTWPTPRSLDVCWTTHIHKQNKPYLIFIIFFTQAKFLENKIYTEKTRKLRQNTQ